MPAVRLNPAVRLGWKVHRLLLRASRGRFGSRMGPFRVLLLETVGHKTGQRRTVGLSHLEDGGRYYVVASYAGEDRDPAWARNLRANHRATVKVGGHTIRVVGRALEGEEREAIFRRFVEADASYDEYRQRTTREIPVFELRPEQS